MYYWLWEVTIQIFIQRIRCPEEDVQTEPKKLKQTCRHRALASLLCLGIWGRKVEGLNICDSLCTRRVGDYKQRSVLEC